MSDDPHGDDIPRTLSSLARYGMTIVAYCAGPACHRRLDVTLADLIRLFGARGSYFLDGQRHWRIVCRACGSREIEWRVSANVRSNGSAKLVHTGYADKPSTYVSHADLEPPLDRVRRLAAETVTTTYRR